MRIQTNIPAMYAYNRYRRTNTDMAKTLEKLSSGFQINRASDDASGLAISEKMRCNLTELERCRRNVSEGINIVKTADAALEEVNEMLIRAHYLCVEAANGTYGEQELDAVGDEINSLFTEIDRITEGSNFNKIPLFRNAVPDSHIERREIFDPLPAGQIETWGGIDFIHGLQKFVAGDKAKGAEATFTLEDGIDFSDKMSLDGKAVTIERNGMKYVYVFDGGTYGSLSYSGNSTYRIDLKSVNSVQDALKRLATVSSTDIISEVKVDQDTREVTLVSKLEDYTTSLSVDGRTENRTVKDGDGTKYQSATVSGPDGKLSFDKIELGNPTYANTATATFDFSFLGTSTINKETCDNLKLNQLVVGDKTIALSDIITGDTINSRTFVQNLSDKINSLDGYTASYNTTSTARKITITATGLSTTSPANILVYEKVTPAGGTGGGYQTALTGKSPGITVTKTQETTGERGAIFEIKVPTANMPQSGSKDAISFRINRPDGGYTAYFLYDTTVNTDEELRKNCPDATGSVYKTVTPTNIHGMSQAEVRDLIIGKIKEIYKEADGYKYTINGDTITLESPVGKTEEPSVSTYPATVQFYKPGETTSTGSKHVLYNQSDTTKGVGASASSYDTKYLKQDAVCTITGLSNTAASIQTLAGKSFQLTNPDGVYLSGTTQGVVFYNSKDGAITAPAGYDLVDVNGISTLAALRTALNNTRLRTDAGFTAAVSGSNITLTLSKNTDGRAVSKSSGYHEVTSIVNGTEKVKFEGGTIAGHDHYSIDFSSITDDNLESLLGKGFRVNCATCSGEYINVVFCWENRGNRMPESFQVLDKASNQMRTIHNVAVELSKVKSASNIVQDIVDQVESQLKHYTALSVDEENPAILIAQDRRVGDVYNGPATPANRVYGSVEGGLKTNFTYNIADVKVRDFPPDGSVYLKDGGVDIYVGSDPDPSLIHLHLPYIDLEALRLGKPGEVNLKASEQNASDWLERINTANNAISKARGILGADQNRLEHTANALACEDENLAAAESRIRDADIAELMMNYTKLQIQIQAQQSMLAQANQRPQSVLQLLD